MTIDKKKIKMFCRLSTKKYKSYEKYKSMKKLWFKKKSKNPCLYEKQFLRFAYFVNKKPSYCIMISWTCIPLYCLYKSL